MLIGITGYAKSGKSAVGKVLVERGWRATAFASTLKKMLLTLGLEHDQVFGATKEVPCDLLCGQTPRHAMQTLGTEWRNMIGQDLWTRIWKREVEELHLSFVNIFVDDLRFPHEVQAIHDLGGKIWKVERPGVGQTHAHESEYHIKHIIADHTIVNYASLDDLRRFVLDALYLEGEAVL